MIGRDIKKSLTWRAIATVIVVCLAWWKTGDFEIAAQIGVFDVGIKLVVYVLHERAWRKWGTRP